MKKFFLTLAVIAAAATTASAQISVGAGYLSSTLNVGNSSVVYNGFHAGADYDYNLFEGLSVVPGVHFAYLSNGKNASVNDLELASGKTTETYVSIPVNVKYEVNFLDALGAFAFAGPQFNVGLSSQYEANVLGVSTKTNNYDDKNYKRFDIAIGVGAGLDVADMVRITFSYNFGLLNKYAIDNVSSKNNYWQVGAAFLF